MRVCVRRYFSLIYERMKGMTIQNSAAYVDSFPIGKLDPELQEFCAGFTVQKKAALKSIDEEIRTIIRNENKEITCRKGCAVCCVLFIEANIQECVAIADYLAQKPDILKAFISRYDNWRHRMTRLGGPFSRCEKILHEDPRSELSEEDRILLIEALKNYQKQNIPCSLLDAEACSIYEVRPYVCANHYVTTPREWCRVENWCNPAFPDKPKIYMTAIDVIDDLCFYTKLKKPVIGFMPTMVYRILTEGKDYINRIADII
jgi:Fe-S-cluster containining protein